MKPYVALEASAGSGKTFALSVRYVALILLGNSPRKILAITFTKKAVREMKDRIVATFCELHLEKRLAERREIAKILSKSEDEILSLRNFYFDKFLEQELKIYTFDAFFGVILRQFSLKLSLMPDFEMSESENLGQKRYFIDKISQHPKSLRAFANYVIANDYDENRIFKGLEFIYGNIKNFKPNLDVKFPDKRLVFDKFNELKNYVFEKYSNKNLLSNFNIKTIQELVKKPIISDLDKNYLVKIKDDSKFMELRDELALLCKNYYVELEKYKINELFSFLEIYAKSKLEYAKDFNILTFEEVAILTNELLSTLDKDMLYFRLDEKITHILIDEFQDTNVIQYEILYPLISEAVAGIGQNGMSSFFYVGDIKQSIYRFRGGKKELFNLLKSNFTQIVSDHLNMNYRSSRLIVNYINSVFKDKIQGYKDQIPNSKDDGFVRVAEFVDIEESLIEQVKFLIKSGVELNDIAILCWKNSDVLYVCDILQSIGVSSISDKTNFLIHSKNVAIVLEYLKYLLFKDKIYIQNVQSFVQNAPLEVELKIDKNVAQILKFITQILGLKPDVNLAKLYEISLEFDDIFDFIFAMNNNKASSVLDSKNGVNVLTVHKSKGLEFKHLIVLDYISRPKSDDSLFFCEYDISSQKWDIGLRDKAMQFLDIQSYKNLSQKSDDLNYEDNLNKIYVALTRARNSLIILIKSNPNGSNPSFFKRYYINSNQKMIEYLNLDIFEAGSVIIEHQKEQINLIQNDNLDPFVEIPKQENVSKIKENDLNLDSIYFGKAMHYGLEILNLKEPNFDLIRSVLINHYQIYIGKDGIDDIVNRFRNLLNCKEFVRIVSNGEIFKEQDVVFENKIKRFDLLVINGQNATIIDYKSSNLMRDNHKTQVMEYISILHKLKPELNIKAYICYLLKDSVELELI